MVKLSDHDANELIDMIKYYLNRLRAEGFRGREIDEQLIIEMESYLKHRQTGLKENVCFYCCGTGYKEGMLK